MPGPRLKLACLIVVALLSDTAAAQTNPAAGNQPIITPQQLQNILGAQPPAEAGPVAEAGDEALLYQPSAERTRANLAAFVEKTRAVDPAGAAQLEQAFASADIIGTIGAELRKVGLDKNNMADAYAVWWVNAWGAAHGDLSESSPAQLQAVSDQAARAMLQTPETIRADDATKQEMAEALLIQAVLVMSSAEAAANDPAAMEQVGQAVRTGALASGIDLDTLRLTEGGFVEAKD